MDELYGVLADISATLNRVADLLDCLIQAVEDGQLGK